MPDVDIDASTADHHRRTAPRRVRRMSSSPRDFVRHYVEMVVAMFLGMVVLGVPAGWTRSAAAGSSSTPTPPR